MRVFHLCVDANPSPKGVNPAAQKLAHLRLPLVRRGLSVQETLPTRIESTHMSQANYIKSMIHLHGLHQTARHQARTGDLFRSGARGTSQFRRRRFVLLELLHRTACPATGF